MNEFKLADRLRIRSNVVAKEKAMVDFQKVYKEVVSLLEKAANDGKFHLTLDSRFRQYALIEITSNNIFLLQEALIKEGCKVDVKGDGPNILEISW